MKRVTIQGFSVNVIDNNLFFGQEFLGDIGVLLGVIRDDLRYFAIMESEDKHLYLKNATLETTIENDKDGSHINQILFLGEENHPLGNGAERFIKNSIKSLGNLEGIYNGEINITAAISQRIPTVFVGSDELINHLNILKRLYPLVPLVDSIHDYPFQTQKNVYK